VKAAARVSWRNRDAALTLVGPYDPDFLSSFQRQLLMNPKHAQTKTTAASIWTIHTRTPIGGGSGCGLLWIAGSMSELRPEL